MNYYYTAIVCFSVIMMLVMEICISFSGILTEEKKRLFRILFAIVALSAACEWISVWFQATGNETRILHLFVRATEMSFAPFVGLLMGITIRRNRAEKGMILFLLFHVVAEYLSGIFGFIYYVNEANQFVHGPCYWIYVVVYSSSFLYVFCIMMSSMKKYQYNGTAFLISLAFFVLICIIVQMLHHELRIVWLALSLGSVFLYIFNSEMIQQTDSLTKLLNRNGYETYINHLQERCMIILFDVDAFKIVNDTYGHAFGDSCLQETGKCIREIYSKFGRCFRIGGDEFCVVLNRMTNKGEDLNVLFSDALRKRREAEEKFPDVSFGFSYYDPASSNFQDCFNEADEMMYRCKRRHKGIPEESSPNE